MCACTPLLPTYSLDFVFAILVARWSRQPQRKDTINGLDKVKPRDISNWKALLIQVVRGIATIPRTGRLLGVEVDTRVGYDALRINGLAGSTAMGILVEYDITLIFDELCRISFSLKLSCRRKLIPTLQVRRARMASVQPPGAPCK